MFFSTILKRIKYCCRFISVSVDSNKPQGKPTLTLFTWEHNRTHVAGSSYKADSKWTKTWQQPKLFCNYLRPYLGFEFNFSFFFSMTYFGFQGQYLGEKGPANSRARVVFTTKIQGILWAPWLSISKNLMKV